MCVVVTLSLHLTEPCFDNGRYNNLRGEIITDRVKDSEVGWRVIGTTESKT